MFTEVESSNVVPMVRMCLYLVCAADCGGAKEEQEVKPANGGTGDKGSVTTMASSDSSDTPCTLQDTRLVATSQTSPDNVEATVSSADCGM
jgi:hypothetical protein